MSRAGRTELRADEILERLVARGVDFVVIGGIAGVLHGSSRATFDLDVCFATDGANWWNVIDREAGLPYEYVTCLALGGDGSLWVGTREGCS